MADQPNALVPTEPLAGRYRLLAWLGAGASGTVYRAEDVRTQRTVVVKLVPEGAPGLRRIERECRVLRALAVPGVVPLLDEGQDGALRFFVTPFVDGSPFPGTISPAGWGTIGPIVQALLRIVADVHACGVIHRDLKPDNVLVDTSGIPHLLDFGLARFVDGPTTLTLTGAVHGTPRYRAPEQVLAEHPVDARADLYALGVMLYEALAGRAPVPARGRGHRYVVRTHREAPPLGSVAPHVPAVVAATVDRLIARSPEDRPGSAEEVLERLAGAAVPSSAGGLVWIGDRAPLREACAAVGRGERVVLGALPGGGRTRALDEIAALLRAEGRRVVWVAPGERPFASLAATLDVEPGPEAAAQVAAIPDRPVLLVEDPDAIDPWSARLLDELGGVIQAGGARVPGAIELRPLSVAALEGIFTGPPVTTARAAALLHERSRGLPSRVVAEVGLWIVEGVARRSGDRLWVLPDALPLVEVGPPPDPRVGRRTIGPARDLLAWIALAEPWATREVLVTATERPRWEIEAELAELRAHGHVLDEGGTLQVRADLRAVDHWSPDTRRQALARLAQVHAVGSPARLSLLLAAEAAPAVRVEAGIQMVRALDEGRSAVALAIGRQAGRVTLESEAPLDTAEAERLARAAIEVGSPAALQAVHALLRRAGAIGEAAGHSAIVSLVQAARERAAGLPFFASQAVPDPALDALRRDLAAEETLLAEGLPVDGDGEPDDRLRAEAWLRLRMGNNEAAASLFARALRRPIGSARTSRLRLGLAAAYLGSGLAREAAEIARGEEERAWRDGRVETALHAATVRRAAGWRLRSAPVDDRLVQSALAIGLHPWTARILLGEAFVAWRASALEDAARLARAAAGATPRGSPSWVLARAVELTCHAGALPEACQELVALADGGSAPGLGLPVRALASLACPALGAALLPGAERCAAARLPLPFDLDLLAPEEALGFCRAAARRRTTVGGPAK